MTFRELNSVEDTALDAANAKLCCANAGYYKDDYIPFFVPEPKHQLPPMNLGYYIRLVSMHEAVVRFHKMHGDNMQVVVLGGGYDTLFWRLRDEGINVLKWFELDFKYVVERKKQVVRGSFFQPLDNYSICECDLGNFAMFQRVLQENSFADIPTIFLDECTLIYVDPNAVDKIISFASKLSHSAFISYGMISPNDKFGQMMVRNFQTFGAPLKGIGTYPTVESHKARFTQAGFPNAKSVDMNFAMKSLLTKEDAHRVVRLEIQDDPEELAFMLMHYVLAIASTDAEFMTLLS